MVVSQWAILAFFVETKILQNILFSVEPRKYTSILYAVVEMRIQTHTCNNKSIQIMVNKNEIEDNEMQERKTFGRLWLADWVTARLIVASCETPIEFSTYIHIRATSKMPETQLFIRYMH